MKRSPEITPVLTHWASTFSSIVNPHHTMLIAHLWVWGGPVNCKDSTYGQIVHKMMKKWQLSKMLKLSKWQCTLLVFIHLILCKWEWPSPYMMSGTLFGVCVVYGSPVEPHVHIQHCPPLLQLNTTCCVLQIHQAHQPIPTAYSTPSSLDNICTTPTGLDLTFARLPSRGLGPCHRPRHQTHTTSAIVHEHMLWDLGSHIRRNVIKIWGWGYLGSEARGPWWSIVSGEVSEGDLPVSHSWQGQRCSGLFCKGPALTKISSLSPFPYLSSS